MINNILYSIIFFFYKLYYYVKCMLTFPILPDISNNTIISSTNQTQQYLLDKTAFFDKHKTDTSTIYPQQIDTFFYDKKQYTNIMKDLYNPYEKQWTTKILFEYTPRGNIIMMYDVYKMGFSYYSDQQNIPYDILNAAAMKYVIQFKCLDFFIDEKYHKSPFLELYEKENVHIQVKINTHIKHHHLSKTDKTLPEIMIRNRFLYKGKISNFSFCQKITKFQSKKYIAVPICKKQNEHRELFEKDIKHISSYKDFKKAMLEIPSETPLSSSNLFYPPSISSNL